MFLWSWIKLQNCQFLCFFSLVWVSPVGSKLLTVDFCWWEVSKPLLFSLFKLIFCLIEDRVCCFLHNLDLWFLDCVRMSGSWKLKMNGFSLANWFLLELGLDQGIIKWYQLRHFGRGGYDSQMRIWIRTWIRRLGIRPCTFENPGHEWGYGYHICNMDFILYIKVFIPSTERIWPRVYTRMVK